jgi:hypothetical protein
VLRAGSTDGFGTGMPTRWIRVRQSPMATGEKAAASTALPHPPGTGRNVPMNSAAIRLEKGTVSGSPFP